MVHQVDGSDAFGLGLNDHAFALLASHSARRMPQTAADASIAMSSAGSPRTALACSRVVKRHFVSPNAIKRSGLDGTDQSVLECCRKIVNLLEDVPGVVVATLVGDPELGLRQQAAEDVAQRLERDLQPVCVLKIESGQALHVDRDCRRR